MSAASCASDAPNVSVRRSRRCSRSCYSRPAAAASAAAAPPAACLEGRFHPSRSAPWAPTTWRPAPRRRGNAPCPGSAGTAAGAPRGSLSLVLPPLRPRPPPWSPPSPLPGPGGHSAGGGSTWTRWARASAA